MHYFWPGLIWIRTLNPPDKVKKEEKSYLQQGLNSGPFVLQAKTISLSHEDLDIKNPKL